MLNSILQNAGISFAFVAVAMIIIWLIGLKIKDISIIDMFWGAGFGLIAAIMYISTGLDTPYLFLLAGLPMLWAIRYTIYIVWRNAGHGEDFRYAALRANYTGDKWASMVFKRIFVFQGFAMWLVAMPIWFGFATGQATEIGLLSKIGAAIWVIGFLFEAIGDLQLARFKARREKLGAEVTGKVMDKGLWKYTRHPNYFGNATMWWGIFLVACQAPFGWLTIVSPIFMTYALLKLTGAAHLERTLSQRPEYRDYMDRTSEFIPWFPKKG